MCQTGMQRINLQPETKIWKCPGGPGGMFLTPNSFSDLSDPACLTAARVQLCRVQPWAAAIKTESVAAAELGHEHQTPQNLLAVTSATKLKRIPASCGKLRSALWYCRENPGAVRVSMSNLLCLADHPLLLGCSCQKIQALSWGVVFRRALWMGWSGSYTKQLEVVSSSVWPVFG